MTKVAGRDRSGCDHKPQSLFSEALWGWVLPIIQGCPRSGLSGLCSPWQPLLSRPWPSQCLEEDGMRCWCCPPRGSSVCRLSSVRLPLHTPGQEPLQPLRQGRHTDLPANTGLECSPRKPELGAWGSMAGLWGVRGVRECRGQGRFPREFLVLQTPPGGSVLAGGAAGQGCPSVFGCVR